MSIVTIFEDVDVETQPEFTPESTKPILPDGYEPAFYTKGLISAWRLRPREVPQDASEAQAEWWLDGYDSYEKLLTMETDHPAGPRFETTLQELAGIDDGSTLLEIA